MIERSVYFPITYNLIPISYFLQHSINPAFFQRPSALHERINHHRNFEIVDHNRHPCEPHWKHGIGTASKLIDDKFIGNPEQM